MRGCRDPERDTKFVHAPGEPGQFNWFASLQIDRHRGFRVRRYHRPALVHSIHEPSRHRMAARGSDGHALVAELLDEGSRLRIGQDARNPGAYKGSCTRKRRQCRELLPQNAVDIFDGVKFQALRARTHLLQCHNNPIVRTSNEDLRCSGMDNLSGLTDECRDVGRPSDDLTWWNVTTEG